MSELEVAGAPGGSAQNSLVAERVPTRYDPEPLLRRMLAVGDVLAVATAAVVVELWGSGAAAALLLVLFAPVWIITAKLAGGDVLAVATAAVVVELWGSGAAAALLLVLFAPVWIITAKLAGLYDRDQVRKLELFPDIHAKIHGQVPSCAQLQGKLQELIAGIDRVVIACSELNEELLEELLPVCRADRVKLTIVPPTRGMFGTATHLTHIADLPLLDYNTWDISRTTVALKRVFDVVVALVGLIVTLPFFLVAGLATLFISGPPIFFRQTRAGERARPFQMLKFRTMVRGAEAMLPDLVPFDELDTPMFKLKGDPRVTRVGRLLRRTSIDELPQLVNVLRGDMSIVGPRPEQLDLVERYAPEHQFRLQVKPGITGPMQVYGRGELTFEERLAVEREYVENLSLARDVRIVLMTLPAVLGKRGAY